MSLKSSVFLSGPAAAGYLDNPNASETTTAGSVTIQMMCGVWLKKGGSIKSPESPLATGVPHECLHC